MDSNKIIGIVGGGQLGRMLTFAAKKLGFIVYILDPTPNSPAGQVANRQFIGSFKDEKNIRELANAVDFLTFEIELANANVLEALMKEGKKINPSPKTLEIIKDKLRQKKFLSLQKIPTASYLEVETKEDVLNAAFIFGYPIVLKARYDAYDGRGNIIIQSVKDIEKGFNKLEGRQLYVEKFVPYSKELAVMVARNAIGEIVCYPVVETTHKNSICYTVIVPAAISNELTQKAKSLAIEVVQHLDGAGVFGIEMFYTQNAEIIINEIAPRVHNSGHYTIEACETSQFEQHIRAITGMQLGSTEMIVPAAAMINILGEHHAKADIKGESKAKAIAGVEVHIYGKHETKIERKMGHITAIGLTAKDALKKALLARKYITI
jgi:5-(carboxyamino)imidazole ribonucleotide synthase